MRHRYRFIGDDDGTEIEIETDTDDAVDTNTTLRSPVPSTRNVNIDSLATAVAQIQRKEVDKTQYHVRDGNVGRSTQHWCVAFLYKFHS